jgi:hypothetical protein
MKTKKCIAETRETKRIIVFSNLQLNLLILLKCKKNKTSDRQLPVMGGGDNRIGTL